MNHALRIVPLDLPAQLASYDNPELPLANELSERILDFIQNTGAAAASSTGKTGR